MARIPYYQDPVFIQKAQQRLPMGQTFSSPFSATQRNVSAAMEARRNQMWGNQMGQANAAAGRRQAQIGYGQAWQGWQGNVNRSARGIQAQEQLEYQRKVEEMRRAAEKRARRRELVGGAIGAIGTIGGAMIGGPVGAAAGGAIGKMAGSQF